MDKETVLLVWALAASAGWMYELWGKWKAKKQIKVLKQKWEVRRAKIKTDVEKVAGTNALATIIDALNTPLDK